MFCTACGTAIPAGQPACPQCGQPLAPAAAPPFPVLGFELERYRGQIRALAIVWLVYAGLSLLLGFAGLTFAHAFFMGGFGPWMPGPWMSGHHMHGEMPPEWLPMAMRFAWFAVAMRALLAFITGWGLLVNARWGRIMAIVFAILSLFRFPLGTALGIWTLVMMLGYRHSTLYEQL